MRQSRQSSVPRGGFRASCIHYRNSFCIFDSSLTETSESYLAARFLSFSLTVSLQSPVASIALVVVASRHHTSLCKWARRIRDGRDDHSFICICATQVRSQCVLLFTLPSRTANARAFKPGVHLANVRCYHYRQMYTLKRMRIERSVPSRGGTSKTIRAWRGRVTRCCSLSEKNQNSIIYLYVRLLHDSNVYLDYIR